MDSQPDHKKNKSIGFERERTLYSASFQVFPSSTTTPQGMYRFSSDHRSQVLSGGVSTWLGDRLGIPRVVDFLDISFWVISHFLVSLSLQRFFFFFFCSALQRRKRLKDGGYRRLPLECQVLVGFLLPGDIFMRRKTFLPRLTIDRGWKEAKA